SAAFLRSAAVFHADSVCHRPLVPQTRVHCIVVHRRDRQQISDVRNHLRNNRNTGDPENCESEVLNFREYVWPLSFSSLPHLRPFRRLPGREFSSSRAGRILSWSGWRNCSRVRVPAQERVAGRGQGLRTRFSGESACFREWTTTL